MKTSLILAAGALLLVAGCGATGNNTTFAETTETVSLSGTIDALDQSNRTFRVRDGRTAVTFRAGPQVQNFGELEVGDTIAIEYYESIAVGMADPSDPGTAVGEVVMGRAAPGERPAGGAIGSVTAVVELISYDAATDLATVKRPDGETETVLVPDDLIPFVAARSPGDNIVVAIDRAVAVAVTETE
ncbi:hypothetical protein CLV78_104340 [Aliiruegeria haliotis]|uniref:DUF5666 domain-containing protein n=1 Tax=Aliiruegeria haliotis TaxID=1280846 RepID=A0A2T0RRV0_9RHOB|nr:hypothetical protein [Aliiruegeria haliotis]PRY23847.1 hypothetical protein CLV78_104340 [Aliiruegeria haliotis]